MSSIETLTQEFYNWEKRCRGWEVYSFPVDLEPPFAPFFFHDIQSFAPTNQIDDGLRPTIISKLFDYIKKVLTPQNVLIKEIESEGPLPPYEFDDLDEPLVAFSISLPSDQKIKPDEVDQLLLMLTGTLYPISFEIIANKISIRIQFVCRDSDSSFVKDQIVAFYPECHFGQGDLDDILPAGKLGYILDFGLQEEFMRPINMPATLEPDPLIGLFGILENLKEDEQAAIQIIFKGTQNAWAESVIRSVLDNNGESFFIDAPEMVKLAHDKVSKPLFGVVVRAIGLNGTGRDNLILQLSNALKLITSSSFNSLAPLSTEGYDKSDFVEDIYLRTSHRLGMLLNSKELATLFHFPSASIHSRKIDRNLRKTKEATKIFLGQKLKLGMNFHNGQEQELTISPVQRLKHIHLIGATGTGKSTLLLNMIVQDISNGDGLAVIDPHGDLIENILPHIPKARHKDVIIIDPADSDFPIGLNILTVHSEVEKEILSSDLVAVFKRLSTSWGDQMNSVFANAILAFLESDKGGTLVDLRRFLIEKEYRSEFLKTVTDPAIVYYWTKEFPILKSTSIGPILTRLDSFLRPKVIRNMVGQQKSLDFSDILDTKKILLVKLSHGLIGEQNSYLLGAFIVSKLQQSAMSRQTMSQAERSNFYVYIDEFQNFITPSMSAILSGARKYHLGLVLAHQDMQQLVKNDSELASSVIANAGTRICFRLGDTDAKKFEGSFSYFNAFDLQNLDTGQAIIRMEKPDNDCNLDIFPLPDLEPEMARKNRDEVIISSRLQFGTKKEAIEEWLNKSLELPHQPLEEPKSPTSEVKTLPADNPKVDIPSENLSDWIVSPARKKEETHHRYLQTLIKKMAESRGYKATCEEATPDNKGRVDVSLERNGKKIAIEIKDTTSDNWELGNIEKCLNAGYDLIIECSDDPKFINRMRQKVDTEFDESELSKIKVYSPEDIFLFLDAEIAKEASTETRVKGYRIKVEYNAISESEMARKREAVVQSVVKSLKNKKGNSGDSI